MHDVVVKRILDVRGGIFGSEKPFVIGFIVGKDELGGVFAIEMVDRKFPWGRMDRRVTREMHLGLGASLAAPGPSITKPEGGQDGERRCFWTAIDRGNPDANVRRRCLGILDENVKVAAFGKDPGVDELELRIQTRAARALVN